MRIELKKTLYYNLFIHSFESLANMPLSHFRLVHLPEGTSFEAGLTLRVYLNCMNMGETLLCELLGFYFFILFLSF